MGFFKRRERASRWFFATDVHGSDRCFRKFLAAPKTYDADVLLLGGDVAGKAIVPIVGNGSEYHVTFQGRSESLGRGQLDDVRERVAFNGLYPYVCTAEEAEALHDPHRRDALFAELIGVQIRGWAELAEQRLADDVRCIITPGNDDPPAVDDELAAATRIECPEREVVSVGPVALASLGNTNRTPWHTDREYDEPELTAQIDEMLRGAPSGSLVFNFHCPPHASGLDVAAELDDELRPVVRNGQMAMAAVGSTAVREAIERYRPVVGLHGHIHESQGVTKIGTSRCFNPGSDYSSGVLKGLIVDFDTRGDCISYLFTNG